MDKRLLILDFDGTLGDTFMHIYNTFKRCINKYNLNDISVEDFLKINGSSLIEILQILGASEDKIDEIRLFYRSIFLDDISDIILYDNVKEVLIELKNRGYLLAIATNRDSNSLSYMLKEFGMFDLFDTYVCIDQVENGKPDPEMINVILDRLNVKCENAIMIGDTNFDILLGQNAKVSTCYACHTKEEDKKVMKCNPDYVIYNFKEILDLLEK